MKEAVVSQSYRLSLPHLSLNRTQLRDISDTYAGSGTFKEERFGTYTSFWRLETGDGSRVYLSSDGQFTFAEKFSEAQSLNEDIIALNMVRTWDVIDRLTQFAESDLKTSTDRIIIRGNSQPAENILGSLKGQAESIEERINSAAPAAGLKIDPLNESGFLVKSFGRIYIATLPILFDGSYESRRREGKAKVV